MSVGGTRAMLTGKTVQSVQAGAEQEERASPHEMSQRERLAGQRGTSAGGKKAMTKGSP